MIIENLNGLIVIYAEGDNKLTTKERTFFTNMIYLGKNDLVEKYTEVPRSVWKNYITEEHEQYELFKLTESLNITNDSVYMLEDIVVETDFRLMIVEMQLESSVVSTMSMNRSATPMALAINTLGKEVITVYELLKKKIIRKTYKTKEDMQIMLDLYFFNDRITAEQYDELTKLLAEQE